MSLRLNFPPFPVRKGVRGMVERVVSAPWQEATPPLIIRTRPAGSVVRCRLPTVQGDHLPRHPVCRRAGEVKRQQPEVSSFREAP